MSRLPGVFLSEFDLRVVATREGVTYTLGINEECSWISDRPTPHTPGFSARKQAESIGNRVLFVTRATLQVGNAPQIMASIVRPEANRCTFSPPLPADGAAASTLLSHLGAFQDWPEVAERLNADRKAMGLSPLTPDEIG